MILIPFARKAILLNLVAMALAFLGLLEPVFGARDIQDRSRRLRQAVIETGDMKCESLLMVDLDDRVNALKNATLVSHEGLDQEFVRQRLSYITPDGKTVIGIFTSESDVTRLQLPSSKNNLAAFTFDQLLGGYAKVPLALEWAHKGEQGVFQVEPRVHVPGKNGAPSRPDTEALANLALFDFLIQKFPRPKEDLVLTANGFAAINNWNAFNGVVARLRMMDDLEIRAQSRGLPRPTRARKRAWRNEDTAQGVRELGILKRSWRHANPAFKRMVLGLERDTLEAELSEVLTADQIEEIWFRLTLIKSL